MTLQSSNLKFTVSAPGKVILHGEHAVVYGKTAIAASLNMRTVLKFDEDDSENSELITLSLPKIHIERTFHLQDIQNQFFNEKSLFAKGMNSFNWERPENLDHSRFIELINKYITEQSNGIDYNFSQKCALSSFLYLFIGMFSSVEIDIKSFKVEVLTELSVGAGCGSSASFSVCIAAAFLQYIRLKKNTSKEFTKKNYKACKLHEFDARSFNKQDLEFISKWSLAAEKIMHGNPSGIDSCICTYGSFIEFRKGSELRNITISSHIKAFLVDTKIARSTATMVQKVKHLKEKHPIVVDNILQVIESISMSALETIIAINKLSSSNDQKDAIEIEYKKLSDLVVINQNQLASLDVSHPAINEICRLSKLYNLPAKLTGSGGGGYVLVLLPPSKALNASQLVVELEKSGFTVITTTLGGSGVMIDFLNL